MLSIFNRNERKTVKILLRKHTLKDIRFEIPYTLIWVKGLFVNKYAATALPDLTLTGSLTEHDYTITETPDPFIWRVTANIQGVVYGGYAYLSEREGYEPLLSFATEPIPEYIEERFDIVNPDIKQLSSEQGLIAYSHHVPKKEDLSNIFEKLCRDFINGEGMLGGDYYVEDGLIKKF